MNKKQRCGILILVVSMLWEVMLLHSMESDFKMCRDEEAYRFINNVKDALKKGSKKEEIYRNGSYGFKNKEYKKLNHDFRTFLLEGSSGLTEEQKISTALKFIGEGACLIEELDLCCSKVQRNENGRRYSIVSDLIEKNQFKLAFLLLGCGYDWMDVSPHTRATASYQCVKELCCRYWSSYKSNDLKGMILAIRGLCRLGVPPISILNKNGKNIFSRLTISFSGNDHEFSLDSLSEFIDNACRYGFYLDDTDLLVCVVEYENLELLKKCVKKGFSLNSANPNGLTPLHQAVYQEWEEGIQYLVKKGALLSAEDLFGQTILFDVTGKQSKYFEKLFTREFVNKKDNRKRTALHIAAARGDVEMVKKLLHAGADVNAQDEWKTTPLLSAIRPENDEKIKILSHHKNNANEYKELYIEWDGPIKSYGRNHANLNPSLGKEVRYQTVKLLCEAGADVNRADYKGLTPLHNAIGYWYHDIIEVLVENGARILNEEHFHNTCLDYLLIQPQPEHYFLSTEGIKIFVKIAEKLYKETQEKKFSIRPALLNNKFLDKKKSLLHLVFENCSCEVTIISAMTHLIKLGERIDSTDEKGKTLLHLAVDENKKEIAQLLINLGASTSIKDQYGKNAEDYAHSSDMKELFKKPKEEGFFNLLYHLSRWQLKSYEDPAEKKTLLKKSQ